MFQCQLVNQFKVLDLASQFKTPGVRRWNRVYPHLFSKTKNNSQIKSVCSLRKCPNKIITVNPQVKVKIKINGLHRQKKIKSIQSQIIFGKKLQKKDRYSMIGHQSGSTSFYISHSTDGTTSRCGSCIPATEDWELGKKEQVQM